MPADRRRFLAAACLAVGTGAGACAMPAAAASAPAAPGASGGDTTLEWPPGRLCVLAYGRQRQALPAGQLSSVIAIDLPSFEVHRIPSPVSNLHGLFPAGPAGSQLWGIGHESAQYLDVFDRRLQRLETRSYPDLRFRGHAVPWQDGLLVSAERRHDPMAGGLLVHLDARGREQGRYPTGGLRPHDIVACGEHFAVAHYGHRSEPAQAPQAAPAGGARCGSAASGLLFDLVSPGVSFLRRTDLVVDAFHRIPGDAAISHLGATADDQVMAMGLNTQRVVSEEALYELATRDNATLLPSELHERGYEIKVPLVRVDPRQGVVATIDLDGSRMRRGQSFAHDPATGLVVATHAASQTLYVQRPGEADRWLSTLDYGVPNPRGCAVLPGTGVVAVSGNEANVALIDVVQQRLVRLVGVTLTGHSHMVWLPH